MKQTETDSLLGDSCQATQPPNHTLARGSPTVTVQETSRWQTVAVRTAWPSCEHERLAHCGRAAVHEQRQWHLWHPQQCARMFPWHTPGSGASHGAGNQREVDEPRNTAAATHPVEAVFACASNAGVILKEHEEYPRTSGSSHSARTERLPLEPCERDSPGLVLIHHRWALHFDACRYCERAWSPGSTVNTGSSLHAHFLSKGLVGCHRHANLLRHVAIHVDRSAAIARNASPCMPAVYQFFPLQSTLAQRFDIIGECVMQHQAERQEFEKIPGNLRVQPSSIITRSNALDIGTERAVCLLSGSHRFLPLQVFPARVFSRLPTIPTCVHTTHVVPLGRCRRRQPPYAHVPDLADSLSFPHSECLAARELS